MCKYWNLIGSYFYKQRVKIASETDCYNWLIDGLQHALEKRVWKNPDNVLFNDDKGPEKAMTVCITSARATFYQYTQHDNRSLNYTLLSLNQLEENSSDGFFLPYEDKYEITQYYIKDILTKFFNDGDYFTCFFIDALFNADLIVDKNNLTDYNINIKEFCKYLDGVTDEYLRRFSMEYELDNQKVLNAFSCVKNLPHYKLHSNINRVVNTLKKDIVLYSLLQD